MEKVDVAIIGSGPGGYVAAIRASQLNLQTLLIEKDDKLGGTCLHRGCIPTKLLLHIAKIYRQGKEAEKFGVICPEIRFNFEKIQNYKDKMVKKLAGGISYLIKKNNISLVKGIGKIKKTNLIEIIDNKGNSVLVEAKNIIIATGSEPRSLPFIKIDNKNIITTDTALNLKSPPCSMLIIGAGAVGVEFATIFSIFGTKVTLVEILDHILPLEDEEIAKELHKILTKQGITIYTKAVIESVSASQESPVVKIKLPDGKVIEEKFEIILVGVGRKPNTEFIGLSDIGIDRQKNGSISVDKFMKTSQPNVYAIGDIVPTPQLAYIASAEGILAVEKIRNLSPNSIDYKKIPKCTFSIPEVASVGLTEKEAIDKGYKITIGKFPFSANSKAIILDEANGFVKVIADKKTNEMLGIHILGPAATEMIEEAVIALNKNIKADEFLWIIHPHPTLSEAISESARNIYGLAIHI